MNFIFDTQDEKINEKNVIMVIDIPSDNLAFKASNQLQLLIALIIIYVHVIPMNIYYNITLNI